VSNTLGDQLSKEPFATHRVRRLEDVVHPLNPGVRPLEYRTFIVRSPLGLDRGRACPGFGTHDRAILGRRQMQRMQPTRNPATISLLFERWATPRPTMRTLSYPA